MPQKKNHFEWIGRIKIKTTRTFQGGRRLCYRRVRRHCKRIVSKQTLELRSCSLPCCYWYFAQYSKIADSTQYYGDEWTDNIKAALDFWKMKWTQQKHYLMLLWAYWLPLPFPRPSILKAVGNCRKEKISQKRMIFHFIFRF